MRRSVYFFGWSTVVVSFILFFSQIIGLAVTNSIDQVSGLLGGYPGMKGGLLGTMSDMFEYNRIWSVYSMFYFAVTLVGGVLFVRFREIGRKILEIACWVGMVNACIDTVVNYVFWQDMEESMKSLVGGIGIALQQLNPLGLGAIIVGFLIWVIPSIGIVIYLRRPSLRALMNKNGAPQVPPTSPNTRESPLTKK